MLFLVCLIRFPTSVFSTHANGLTTVLYGGTLGAIFLVQVASWVHARKAGLLLSVVDRTVYLTTRNQLLAVGLVFVLGMTVMIVGILLMLWQRITMPGFFKGETLTRGVSDGHEDDAVTLPE